MAAAGAIFRSDLPNGEISFALLEKITENFSTVIGTPGEIGTVYKGTMVDGRVVAVKRHAANTLGRRSKEEYCTQVRSIMKHEDDNIVKLLGFCHHNGNRRVRSGRTVREEKVVESLLCYDYYSNGNLHSLLFGKPPTIINWSERFKIIRGICRGLHSLHMSSERIIHLNLKPQNILLGQDMVPKITDFVYSRILGESQTRQYTKSKVGSVGYKAPEYLDEDQISARTDIYALGLIILEITTKEENPRSNDKQSAREYIDEVEENWDDKRRKQSIMSRYTGLDSKGRIEVEACIKIGLECVNLVENERPTIEQIVRDLRA